MKNECPACGAVYSVTPQHIGRRIACKKCGAGLVVEAEGIELAGAAARSGDVPPTYAEGVPAPLPAPVQPLAGLAPAAEESPYRRAPAGSSVLVDYLLFRRMLTPFLIQIIFWISVAFFVITGAGTFVFAVMASGSSGVTILMAFVYAAAQIILGPIMVRVTCEMIMVVFRIHETLLEIKKKSG
jgi:hypothetical protein